MKISGDFWVLPFEGEWGIWGPLKTLNSSHSNATAQAQRKRPFRWKVTPEILAVVVIAEANYPTEVLQLKNKSTGILSEFVKLKILLL